MLVLKQTGSPVSRTERNNVNENWDAITQEFAQVNSSVNVLNNRIDDAKSNADAALEITNTVEARVVRANYVSDQAKDISNESLRLVNEKIVEVDEVVVEANDAIQATNAVKNESVIATVNTNQAITNAIQATTAANVATTNATSQATYAKSQGDYAKQVGDDNKNVLLAPVANFAALATTYPNRVFGSKVQTIDDGKFYRWNGMAWAYVEVLNSNIITDIQAQLTETARQNITVENGVSVISGEPSPIDIEIQGRTLIPLQNNVLEASKYYVLADRKTKLQWTDTTRTSGVSKFTGKAEKPTIIRIANFEGKVEGSTIENPHKAYENGSSTFGTPSSFVKEYTQKSYDYVNVSDNTVKGTIATVNLQHAQQLFSFNVIEEVERQLGRIPSSTISGKIQWLATNVKRATCLWRGYGSSVSGNKVMLNIWDNFESRWAINPKSHTSSNIAELYIYWSNFHAGIDSNGFYHFLAYSEPSDGVTASTVHTDYVELVIELKPEATLFEPSVPFYEVTQDEYNKILVDWDENAVINKYPKVQGIKHLTNPYILMEGENLLPPFTEWILHADARVINPYMLETVGKTVASTSRYVVPNVPNRTYYLNSPDNSTYMVVYLDINGVPMPGSGNPGSGSLLSNRLIIPPYGCAFISISAYCTQIGKNVHTNPMLTLGSTPKPFVPRNTSKLYLSDVKLGQIGNIKDMIYRKDGKYLMLETLAKDIELDGTMSWIIGSSYTDSKAFGISILNNTSSVIGVKYNGGLLTSNLPLGSPDRIASSGNQLYVGVSNSDSGFDADTYPSMYHMKAYFNGWKYTGDGTVNSWVSIVDGSLPAINTLDYVVNNRSEGYTPYKISYVLKTPTVTDITDKVEGDLTVRETHTVTVGSGFTYVDNDDNRTYSIIPEAERYLSTVNATEVKLTYSNNIRSALEDVVVVQSGIATEVSIQNLELKKLNNKLDDVSQYVTMPKVVGVEWDFVSDMYKRLGSAVGKTAGKDFDNMRAFGGRRRVNLSDDGFVNAYFGDPTYKEDGSNGQVMVEQPLFWYKTEFTDRTIRWWVSDVELSDFKIHPNFIVDGQVVPLVYSAAFEGNVFDVSGATYLLNDEQISDFTPTTGDKLSSIANAKPCSGLTQNLTIVNSRILANNRGIGWGLHDFNMASSSQLLMLVEYATFNMQNAIGLGVVSKASGTGNESELTGKTSTLGNNSGMATGTNGLTSVTYRGEENLWGNINTWLDGLNISNMVPYINTTNSDFVTNKLVDNYKSLGYTLPASGYQKTLHITNEFDFGFLPKTTGGSATTFITDQTYTSSGGQVALLGGSWDSSLRAGARSLYLHDAASIRVRSVSARLSFRKKNID